MFATTPFVSTQDHMRQRARDVIRVLVAFPPYAIQPAFSLYAPKSLTENMSNTASGGVNVRNAEISTGSPPKHITMYRHRRIAMAKMLLMDRCFMCFYSTQTEAGRMCWHSESAAFDDVRIRATDPIPDWCPLPDAREGSDGEIQ